LTWFMNFWDTSVSNRWKLSKGTYVTLFTSNSSICRNVSSKFTDCCLISSKISLILWFSANIFWNISTLCEFSTLLKSPNQFMCPLTFEYETSALTKFSWLSLIEISAFPNFGSHKRYALWHCGSTESLPTAVFMFKEASSRSASSFAICLASAILFGKDSWGGCRVKWISWLYFCNLPQHHAGKPRSVAAERYWRTIHAASLLIPMRLYIIFISYYIMFQPEWWLSMSRELPDFYMNIYPKQTMKHIRTFAHPEHNFSHYLILKSSIHTTYPTSFLMRLHACVSISIIACCSIWWKLRSLKKATHKNIPNLKSEKKIW
jgi:hypothetical protein